MRRNLALVPLLVGALATTAAAQEGHDHAQLEALVRNALTAAPQSITQHATVVDHHFNVLREGRADWVCMPTLPDARGADAPMCIDAAWQEFLGAWTNRRAPNFTGVGIGYMLRGDYPTSNLDPYAEGPTPDNQWLADAGPHIMIIVSDVSLLADMTSDPHNGGPWVMWPGTPYAHIMVPLPRMADER